MDSIALPGWSYQDIRKLAKFKDSKSALSGIQGVYCSVDAEFSGPFEGAFWNLGWAWADASDIEENTETWTVRLMEEGNVPSGWAQFQSPPGWGGQFKRLYQSVDGSGGLVVGRFVQGEKKATWVAPYTLSKPPEIPALGPGVTGIFSTEEADFLGVLRLDPRNVVPYKRGPEPPLQAAWAKSGEFWGWESVTTLRDVGDLDMPRAVALVTNPDWEKIEKGLRSDFWGREI